MSSGILAMLGPAQPGSQPFGPITIGDDWTPAAPYQLWHANKLTVTVAGAGVLVRLARSMPPDPPEWDPPFPLQAGPWSHVGPFGYWQFKNAVPGSPAIVQGSAFRE